MASSNPETVLVTGFGPFAGNTINASWEVAKELPKLNTEEELGIKLVIEEIPVAYDVVMEKVPALWKKYNPSVVVHMGVSWMACELTLESCAHKSGYGKDDVCGKLPEQGECNLGSCDKKQTVFDLKEVVEEVNSANLGIKACISNDAGRYLCEFIYYTSLCIDETCTLFIHVPEIDEPFTVLQMAQGVKKILSIIIHQRRQHKDKLAIENEL